MRAILLAATAILLTGCVTPETTAQREYDRMGEAAYQGRGETEACTRRVRSGQTYQALQDKIGIASMSPTLEQQANPAKATPRDIDLVYALHGETAECRKIYLEALGRVNPLLASVRAEYYAQQDALLLKLIKRQSTWGEFVQADHQANVASNAKMQATSRQIKLQLDRSNNDEIAQRRAATASFQQWAFQQQLLMQQQQAVDQQNRVRVTNCQYVGGTLSCTTI